MPYKFETEKMLIPRKLDKRVKLTLEEKDDIRKSYNQGGYSQRQLARLYGVSRRTIQFIVNPTSLEENIERRKERGGSAQYYDKDKNTTYINRWRKHKKSLYDSKKLIEARK